MKNHRGCQQCNRKKCLGCQGVDQCAYVESVIKKLGMAVVCVQDVEVTYSVGMSGGAKGGCEFVLVGLPGEMSGALLFQMREQLERIKDCLETGVCDNFLPYANAQGQQLMGPIALKQLPEASKRKWCTMFERQFHHNDFAAYQVWICDDRGRLPSELAYDANLLAAQRTL